MKCSDYEILISAYADGELDAAQISELESHMKCCEHCRTLYKETLDLQCNLSDALEACSTFPDIASSISDKIQPKRKFHYIWTLAAAAVVVFGIFICEFRQPVVQNMNMPRFVVSSKKHNSVPAEKHFSDKNCAAKTSRNENSQTVCIKPNTVQKKHIYNSEHSSVKKISEANGAGATSKNAYQSVIAKNTEPVPETIDNDDNSYAAEFSVEYTDTQPSAQKSSEILCTAFPSDDGKNSRLMAKNAAITMDGKKIERVSFFKLYGNSANMMLSMSNNGEQDENK